MTKKRKNQAFDVQAVLQAIQSNPELFAQITGANQTTSKTRENTDKEREKFRQLRWMLFEGLKAGGCDRVRYRGGWIFARKENPKAENGYRYLSIELKKDDGIYLYQSEFESRSVIHRSLLQKQKYNKTGVAKILNTVATL